MQRILYFFALVLATNVNLLAQEKKDGIWNRKEDNSNGFNLRKQPPPPSDPIPNDIPIDGGIGVLLIAGALYGKNRIDKARKSGQN